MTGIVAAKALHATITYWGAPTQNGFGGYDWPDPIEIKARWEEREEKLINLQGEEIVSKAIVYTDRELELGGYLYNGISTEEDPSLVPGAYYIQQQRVIPDIRGLNKSIRVYV